MRTKLLFVFLFSLLLISCNGNNDAVTGIILQVSANSIPNDGSEAVFKALTQNGKDITEQAVIYQENGDNLQIIKNNVFSSRKPGEYYFHAEYNGYKSEQVIISVEAVAPTLILKVSSYNIADDGVDAIEFTVYNLDMDVTSKSEIYNVTDGGKELVADNRFVSTTEGIYEFAASFEGTESDIVQVAVESANTFTLPADMLPDNVNFHNKVMVMKFTGTGCAYCPLPSAAIKEVLKDPYYADKMSVVEAHNYNESDPMMNEVTYRLRDVYSIEGWPLVIYNLQKDICHGNEGGEESNPKKIFQANTDTIKNCVDKQWVSCADAGISAVSVIENGSVKIKAAVKAGKAAEYYLGVFLMEDNIRQPQNEYEPDKESYPADFDPNRHYHVLRAVHDACDIATTDFAGMGLGMIEAGKTADIEMNITISDNLVIENTYLMFYVSTREEGRVMVRNAVTASIGKKIPYNYNN